MKFATKISLNWFYRPAFFQNFSIVLKFFTKISLTNFGKLEKVGNFRQADFYKNFLVEQKILKIFRKSSAKVRGSSGPSGTDPAGQHPFRRPGPDPVHSRLAARPFSRRPAATLAARHCHRRQVGLAFVAASGRRVVGGDGLYKVVFIKNFYEY